MRDPRAVFARDLVPGGDVDHVDEEVDEGGAEGQGEVVAAAFDQDHVGVGESLLHLLDRGQVHAGVLADGRVRAGAGLDADDAVFAEHTREGALHVLGVLGGHDVVGDDQDLQAHSDQLGRHGLDECRLPGAYWAADADAGGPCHHVTSAHEHAHI